MHLQSGRPERPERLYVHSDGVSIQLPTPVALEVGADVDFEGDHGQIQGILDRHAGF